MEVHHAIPKSQGGNDSYNNLIYITKDVHKLIHATQLETVNKYLNLISVGKDTIELINGCRKLANNSEICL